jgi:peptidoglycan/LPS O-acetylase OafA/YrhL
MAAIAAGVLGALWVRSRPPSARDARALRWFGGAAMAAMITLTAPWLWRSLHDGVMLMLTLATLCLLVGMHRSAASRTSVRGLGWLESWGRLSYEIYLTHMFVVFAAVRLWRALGGDMRAGAWLYVPTVTLCWLLGRAVARFLSQPCDRWLRARLLQPVLPHQATQM